MSISSKCSSFIYLQNDTMAYMEPLPPPPPSSPTPTPPSSPMSTQTLALSTSVHSSISQPNTTFIRHSVPYFNQNNYVNQQVMPYETIAPRPYSSSRIPYEQNSFLEKSSSAHPYCRIGNQMEESSTESDEGSNDDNILPYGFNSDNTQGTNCSRKALIKNFNKSTDTKRVPNDKDIEMQPCKFSRISRQTKQKMASMSNEDFYLISDNENNEKFTKEGFHSKQSIGQLLSHLIVFLMKVVIVISILTLLLFVLTFGVFLIYKQIHAYQHNISPMLFHKYTIIANRTNPESYIVIDPEMEDV